ncbi:hypothetical protein BGZ76_001932 [Entomortierella beljakovae]|nr:hypothetical protein BGZ76_001932 [Entomortierella beljakovae]
MNTPGNDKTPHQIVNGVLERFGLDLKVPYQPSGIALLQSLYINRSRYDDIVCDSSTFSTLTIDYSKLSTSLPEFDPDDDFQLICRCKGSQETNQLRSNGKANESSLEDSDHEGSDYEDSDHEDSDHDDSDHDDSNCEDSDHEDSDHEDSDHEDSNHEDSDHEDSDHDDNNHYDSYYEYNRYQADFEEQDILNEKVICMLMHYNYDYIKDLQIRVHQIQMYLPFATKLASLEILHLTRDKVTSDSHLIGMVSFIQQNRLAFPRKKPLHIVFVDGWDNVFSIGNVWNDMEQYTYLKLLEQFRNKLSHFTRPMISILTEARKPRELKVSGIPNFYKDARSIETDRLVTLYDIDCYRFWMGETMAQEAFLQRCSNLRTLAIAVSCPDAFSWAKKERLAASKSTLMRLEDLTIYWNHECFTAIMALNECIVLFASSLKRVSLESDFLNARHIYNEPHYTIRNAGTLMSLQLQDRTLANTIGNFPASLLNLTVLCIDLPAFSSINIGSLDNSPNLEYLEIVLGANHNDCRRPQGGNVPTNHPRPGKLLNPRWRYTEVNYSLFPIWNLSKVKKLKLKGMAAIRFDLASLPTMQSLEELTIDGLDYHHFAKHCITEQKIKDYLIRQHKMPLATKSPSTSEILELDQEFGIFGSYSSQEWSLPKLSSMQIAGEPTSVFCLEYLRLFPALKSLSVSNPGYPTELRRNPLLPQIHSESIVFSSNVLTFDNTKLTGSSLDTFRMTGDWNISVAALTSLLTIYAPSIKAFHTDEYVCYGHNGGFTVVEIEPLKSIRTSFPEPEYSSSVDYEDDSDDYQNDA